MSEHKQPPEKIKMCTGPGMSAVYLEASQHVRAVQIIDAQKARLKRELKALEGRVQEAAAGKAQAETLSRQRHDADMADASAGQPTIDARHKQRTDYLQCQVDDTGRQPEEAAEHAQLSAEGQENEVRVSGFNIFKHYWLTVHTSRQVLHIAEARSRLGMLGATQSFCYSVDRYKQRSQFMVRSHRLDVPMQDPARGAASKEHDHEVKVTQAEQHAQKSHSRGVLGAANG